MPKIKVNTARLSGYEADMQGILGRVNSIISQYDSISGNLDWDIRAESNINSRLSAISRDLSSEARGISGLKTYLGNARIKYDAVDALNKQKKTLKETMGSGIAAGVIANLGENKSDSESGHLAYGLLFGNPIYHGGIMLKEEDSGSSKGLTMLSILKKAGKSLNGKNAVQNARTSKAICAAALASPVLATPLTPGLSA